MARACKMRQSQRSVGNAQEDGQCIQQKLRRKKGKLVERPHDDFMSEYFMSCYGVSCDDAL
jgi:hypothetical protein